MAIKYEKAGGKFTSFAGLGLSEQIIKTAKLKTKLRSYLPTGQRITAEKSFNKFIALLYGMIVGNDCLDDMDRVTQDPMFAALCKSKTHSSQHYGAFLRSFSAWQISKLNDQLKSYALYCRQHAFPKDLDLVLDIDSTLHRQYGKKMEGVTSCYEKFLALSSLHVYDQYGFQYHIDVRKGSTHTAKGAQHVIRDLFKGISRKYRRLLRADSGYCNHGIIKACLESNADFVICMPENMYAPLLERVRSEWWKWKESKNVKFKDGRKAELTSVPYYIRGISKAMRVVVMRAKKSQPTIFGERYDYRAFVTNMSQSEMNDEEVINCYKKRGNAENYIKESKNSFDLHHFPCQSLQANKVWALIAAFAFNTLRFQAPVLNPKQLHFAKRIRFRMVYLGAHVVKKSRYWIIRLNNFHHEEVERFQCRIQHLLTPG